MATFPQLRDANLIDFNSPGNRTINKLKSDSILIIKDSPEMLSRSFGMNNPFDQVLYEAHLNFLKETDPFEIVSEAAFGDKKSNVLLGKSMRNESTAHLLPLEDDNLLRTPDTNRLNQNNSNSLNLLNMSSMMDSLNEFKTPKNDENNSQRNPDEDSDILNKAFKVDTSGDILDEKRESNNTKIVTPQNNIFNLNKSSEEIKNSSSSSLDLIDDEIISSADKAWNTIDKNFDSKFLDMDSILLNPNEEFEDLKMASFDMSRNSEDFYTIKSKSQNIPLVLDEQISPTSKERAQDLVAELNHILNKSLTNVVSQETMRHRSKSFSQLPTARLNSSIKQNDGIKKRLNNSFDEDKIMSRSFSFSKTPNTSLDKIEEIDLNEPLVKAKSKLIEKTLEKKAPIFSNIGQRLTRKFQFKPGDVKDNAKVNVKKGPLKAVIPIGNMVAKVATEKKSKSELKITTTPKIAGSKLTKPLAQSTPERKFLQNISPLAEVTSTKQGTPQRNILSKGNVPRRSSFSGVNKKIDKPNLNRSDSSDKANKSSSLLRPLNMISKLHRSWSGSRIGKENVGKY